MLRDADGPDSIHPRVVVRTFKPIEGLDDTAVQPRLRRALQPHSLMMVVEALDALLYCNHHHSRGRLQ